MPLPRPLTALLLGLALAGGAAGCGTDDAVERDARDAGEEVEREAGEAGEEVDREAGEAGDDIERAVPGDADDDGR